MNDKKVSIIILNWNGLKDTVECLESVKKIDYPNYEVIVVDNSSTDGSSDKIKELFPDVAIIRNDKNMGFACGNNIGIKYAIDQMTDYIWLLNNDALAYPDTLTKLVSVAESDDTIGILSPLIYHYHNVTSAQCCGCYLDWDNYTFIDIRNISDISKMKSADIMLYATALLIKRKVIEKIGYFDEKYFAYCEDTDFSLRARRAGFRNTIDMQSKILHKMEYVNSEVRQKSYFYYYITRNKYMFWRKNGHFMTTPFFMLRYIKRTISDVIRFKKLSCYDAIGACLDGMYSAMFDITGEQAEGGKMPAKLKTFIVNHPYFVMNLLSGDLVKIINSAFNGIKKKCIIYAK